MQVKRKCKTLIRSRSLLPTDVIMIFKTTPTWEQLLELAQERTLQRRVRRPGQSPSIAPIPSSLHKLPPATLLPVLLYRDISAGTAIAFRAAADKVLTSLY